MTRFVITSALCFFFAACSKEEGLSVRGVIPMDSELVISR